MGEFRAPEFRNARCPCGSGIRYKECHGVLVLAGADPLRSRLAEAGRHLRAGEAVAAEQGAGAILAERPDQPEALRILARCAYERGLPRDGLATILKAARAMQTQRVSPAAEFEIWSDLGFLFGLALPGIDSALAARRRLDYARRAIAAVPDDEATTVTIVVIASVDHALTLQSLCSLIAPNDQHEPAAGGPEVEVLIVYAGSDPRSDPAVALAGTSLTAIRWLQVEGASAAMLADHGVRAATGELVNVLQAPHRFAHTRIRTMRNALLRQHAAWGFSAVAFEGANGAPLPSKLDWQVRIWRDRQVALSEADTIGFALIHQDFVAVDVGNLMFSRALYDAVGGFRADAPLWAWDFCLRAVLEAEPAFVPTREFVHVTIHPSNLPTRHSREFEVAQIAMFARYYARTCTETPFPNPFAPCIAYWGFHFLKSVFQSGHVLALQLPELERLGNAVLERSAARGDGGLAPGVDLVGFVYGEFGLGENLRAFARACLGAGIPFNLHDLDLPLATRQADRSMAPYATDTLRHNCAVFCLNPDMLNPLRPLLVESAAARRRNIGYWFWELEQVPDEWTRYLVDIDEIWVATEFIADAMRRVTDKPVIKIPTPVEVRLLRAYSRTEFGLPDDRFLFLFSFDFNSFSARKNPEGAILAFQRAFAPARRDVGLVIKSINGRHRPLALQALQRLIGNDDRIVIVDEFYAREQVSGLQSVVDAYVSLHRAEGLGLGLAESMYLGKPVIGTRYSGNLEFMDDTNSCLVDCTLVPVRKGEYLYDDERFRWAEPDLDGAARAMRRLVDDAGFRDRIARRGQEHVRATLSLDAAAVLMQKRLSALNLL